MQELAKQFRRIMNTQKSPDLTSVVLNEMEAEENSKGFIKSIQLPSNLQPNQVCYLQFRKSDNPLTATVRCVHFYIGKVKYDLGIWLGDGTVDDPEYETRIYNVDSVFVTPA